MITHVFANNFAHEWIKAWNSHDLDLMLSHYTDDFEMASPYIAQIANEPTGMLKGKTRVAAYLTSALERAPTLYLELHSILAGAESLVIYYRGTRGMAAEIFFFNSDGRVVKACAHYA